MLAVDIISSYVLAIVHEAYFKGSADAFVGTPLVMEPFAGGKTYLNP
jgi:hypothetical protein